MTAWRHRSSRSRSAAIILAVSLGAGGSVALDSPHLVSKRAPQSPAAGLLGRHSVTIPRGPRWHWVSTWAAGAQRAVSTNHSERGFGNQTIREIVVASAQGSIIRIRLTNRFGSKRLRIGQASIAVQRSDARPVSGTTRTVTFADRQSVLISRGASVLSDPIRLVVIPQTHLLISLYLPAATGPATEHRQAHQINYVASGDHALDHSGRAFATRTDSWFFLDGVEVLAPARDLGTVVALGDSITDGVGSPVNADERWPNFLARRLSALNGRTLSVVDEGIGGNRVLNTSTCCGVSAAARFKTDVGDQAAVRDVILLEGINDIGFSQSHKRSTAPHSHVSARQIIDGYRRIIRLARAVGIRILGGTLTPFRGAFYWTPQGEAEREAINRWIRTRGAFDGVVDFARAIRDPHDAERLAPAYDSGDQLHPNAAGYRAMANAVQLAMLFGPRPTDSSVDRCQLARAVSVDVQWAVWMTSLRILGPVEVWHGEQRLALGGPRQLSAVRLPGATRQPGCVDGRTDRCGVGTCSVGCRQSAADGDRAPAQGAGAAQRRSRDRGCRRSAAAICCRSLPASWTPTRSTPASTPGRARLTPAHPPKRPICSDEALALWRGPPLGRGRVRGLRARTRSAAWRSCESARSSAGSTPSFNWDATPS